VFQDRAKLAPHPPMSWPPLRRPSMVPLEAWMAWGRLATAYRRPAMTSGVRWESDVSSALVRQVQGPEGATSGRVEYEKMEYAFVDRRNRGRGADSGCHYSSAMRRLG